MPAWSLAVRARQARISDVGGHQQQRDEQGAGGDVADPAAGGAARASWAVSLTSPLRPSMVLRKVATGRAGLGPRRGVLAVEGAYVGGDGDRGLAAEPGVVYRHLAVGLRVVMEVVSFGQVGRIRGPGSGAGEADHQLTNGCQARGRSIPGQPLRRSPRGVVAGAGRRSAVVVRVIAAGLNRDLPWCRPAGRQGVPPW